MTEQLSIVAEAQKRMVSTPAELKSLREAAGLSIPGTAGQLRLAARQVEALELGEWDKLPGIAFIKGALRSYGRLLSADTSPLIAYVDQQLGQNELKADRTLDGKIPERSALGFGEGGKGNKWAWVGLALVGLAAIALFFGQGLESYIPKQFIPPSKMMDIGKPGASGTSEASGVAASPSGSATDNASSSKASSLGLGTGSATPSVGEVAKPASAAASTPNPVAAPPAAPGVPSSGLALESPRPASAGVVDSPSAGLSAPQSSDLSFQVKFAKDSWVEIKDASGERVLYGTQVGGTNHILKGKPPYVAVIGNAIHVKIEKKEGASGSEQIVPMPKEMPQGIARLTIR